MSAKTSKPAAIADQPASSNGQASASKQAYRRKLSLLEHKVGLWFSIFIKAGAMTLIILLAIMILVGLQDDSYTVKPFSVPQEFADRGMDGRVLVSQILDRGLALKQEVSSIKADQSYVNDAQKPEMEVAVLGLGLSVKSTILSLKSLLGRPIKQISGELVSLDSSLQLTLRISGLPVQTLVEPVDARGLNKAIEHLIDQAAKAFLQKTDPYRLALYYAETDQEKKALEIIEYMRTYDQAESAWMYHAWARLLYRQENYEASMDRSRRSLKRDPNFTLGYLNLATCYGMLDSTQKSIAYHQKVVQLDPQNAWRRVGLAWAYARDGKLTMADKHMEEAKAMEDEDILIVTNHGWIHHNWGDEEKAVGFLEDAYLREPDNPSTWDGMGIVLQYKRDLEYAYQELKRMESYNPYSGYVKAIMSSYHQVVNNIPEAIRYAQATLEVGGDSTRAYFQLGGLYAQQQEISLAYQYLNQGFARDTTAIGILTLAEIKYFEGDKEAFYQHLETVLKRGFTFNDLALASAPFNTLMGDARFRDVMKKYDQPLPPTAP
ncbi:MAG: hypothetical protein AAFR61_22395 [Bacteroidota bacterium]